MKMRQLLSLIVCVLISLPLSAQNFLTPVSSLTGDAVAVTQDGKEISGDIRTALFGSRGLMSFAIKDAAGKKHKFKAADVKSLKVKVDGLAKLEMFTEKTTSLKKMINSDFDEIADREYIYYEQVQVPGKKKYVLAQLLNPGWDSKVKVYNNPIGSETQGVGVGGVALTGGEAKTYIVVANEKPSVLVKKGKYEDRWFGELFNSCGDMETNFQGKDRKFKNFAVHVFAYDQGC